MVCAWVLLLFAQWTCAQYYGGRCPCPIPMQPPLQPHGPCAPPVPCPPVPVSCLPFLGKPHIPPGHPISVFPPAYPPMQPGRGYGYVLPQPYTYYLRESDLSNLQKQIKTIEVSDEKSHTSPFDTVEVTPVKSTEVECGNLQTAPEMHILSPQTAYIHTPLPEPPSYPPVGGSSVAAGGILGYAPGQPPYYHVPIPEPIASIRPHPGYIHSPLNDCCVRCPTPCHYRARRNLHIHSDKTNSKEMNPAKCTDEKLMNIMRKTINSSVSSSKREIQKLAEEAFSSDFHVICSHEDFSYISRTSTFCQASKDGISCYAFQTESTQ